MVGSLIILFHSLLIAVTYMYGNIITAARGGTDNTSRRNVHNSNTITTMCTVIILLYARNEHLERRAVAAGRSVLMVQMYRKKVALFQVPSFMMHQSSRPGLCSRCGCPYLEAVPCELLFHEAKILEGLSGDLHELPLGRSCAVAEDEEGHPAKFFSLMDAATTATGKRWSPALPMITSVPLPN